MKHEQFLRAAGSVLAYTTILLAVLNCGDGTTGPVLNFNASYELRAIDGTSPGPDVPRGGCDFVAGGSLRFAPGPNTNRGLVIAKHRLTMDRTTHEEVEVQDTLNYLRIDREIVLTWSGGASILRVERDGQLRSSDSNCYMGATGAQRDIRRQLEYSPTQTTTP